MLDVLSIRKDHINMSAEDMMQTLFMSASEERQRKTADTVGKLKAEGRNLSSGPAVLAWMQESLPEAHSPSHSPGMFNNYHGV